MPELLGSIHPPGAGHFGVAERGISGLVNQDLLCRILTRMLDENEFLSIRSGEFRDPTSLAHQELIDILQPLARK